MLIMLVNDRQWPNVVFRNEQSTFQLKITAEYKLWRHIHTD